MTTLGYVLQVASQTVCFQASRPNRPATLSAFPPQRALICVSFIKQIFIRLAGASVFLEDSIPLSDLGISLNKSRSSQGMDKHQVKREVISPA